MKYLILITLFFMIWEIVAKNPDEFKVINIDYATSKVIIDGILNESIWQSTAIADNFINKWPQDTGLAASQTEAYFFFDNEFLYFGMICHETSSKADVISTLKRDVGHWNSDAIAVVLDPLNQKMNGYIFGVNIGGAQTEGLISPSNTSFEWDAKWYSAVKVYDKKWTAEIAIPFKTIRYGANLDWGVNFIRNDVKNNEYSTWSRIPRQFRGTDLGYTGILTFDKKPKSSKSNIVLIPYIFGSASRDFEEDSVTIIKANTGLDAKIAITPTLNLDVTINPDFSQVDVDRQVTNLSRFSIFFPERRAFFLENSDIFSNFGTFPIRPFFSRRIGIYDGNPVPIMFGLRLSGNINKNWRTGLLNMQTNKTEDLQAQNYTVFSLQRRLLKRSILRTLLINRQSYTQAEVFRTDDYNRVGALEFNYISQDGKWRGIASYHQTTTQDKFNDGGFSMLGFRYRDNTFTTSLALRDLGTNYITDLGFVQRLSNHDALRDTSIRIGYYQIRNTLNYQIFNQSSSPILRHEFDLVHQIFWSKLNGELFEYNARFAFRLGFKNRSFFEARSDYNFVNLPLHTSVISIDEATEEYLPPATYRYVSGNIRYNTDTRKPFNVRSFVNYGQFYNGIRFGFGGSLNYRRQPWGNFGVDFQQNFIQLPDNYGSTTLTLIQPTIEINFTNNMFWTTFIQLNTQNSTFGINSRFQWRYLPMSDLFLVYTDNYVGQDGSNFTADSRALVLKINYWLNI